MSTREDREDALHTMRAMRDKAEVVCATGSHTSQDWDDLQHFRAEVHRLEAELSGGDGTAPVPIATAAPPVARKSARARGLVRQK